jgi:hypothetical protein
MVLAISCVIALLYTRLLVSASYTSANATIRPDNGICSPVSFAGYPLPSHRSWCVAAISAATLRNRAVGRLAAGGAQRLGAQRRVRLHDVELFVRQPARLQQHEVRDCHLADVVQRTGVADQRDEIRVDDRRVQPAAQEVGGENLAVALHAFEVRAGFGVARFGELRQREDRHVTALELQDSLGDADAAREFFRIEWLGDESSAPAAKPSTRFSAESREVSSRTYTYASVGRWRIARQSRGPFMPGIIQSEMTTWHVPPPRSTSSASAPLAAVRRRGRIRAARGRAVPGPTARHRRSEFSQIRSLAGACNGIAPSQIG